MTQLSLQIPVDGQPFATEGPKVGTSLTQIQTVVNGGLDTGNLSPTAAVADTQLASPNNATYKQIVALSPILGSLNSGATYTLGPTAPDTSARVLVPSTLGIFPLDPADYTAGSRGNKYRLRVGLLTNATAATSTFTFGVYPVSSVAGAANLVTATLGTVVSGSTCAFVAPAASSLVAPVSSGDFTAPAAGYYVIGVAVSVASMAVNSAIVAGAVLQHRQV